MAKQDQAKRKRSAKDPISKKDPTIRQEFPGADTNKKKIEAGIRNIKTDPPAAPENKPASSPVDGNQ
ncbi:MAG TPA: hypothetical protein VGO58_08425 [Chitinophagaceae bacterium]|jgi:hypothetical protein|nr:hypothetical protein [Chitinophagaceae bacterium]